MRRAAEEEQLTLTSFNALLRETAAQIKLHRAQPSTPSISNHPSVLRLTARKYLSQPYSRPKPHWVTTQVILYPPTIGPMSPQVPRGSTTRCHQSTCTRTSLHILSTSRPSCGYVERTTRSSLIHRYFALVSCDSYESLPSGRA